MKKVLLAVMVMVSGLAISPVNETQNEEQTIVELNEQLNDREEQNIDALNAVIKK